ncbi:gamma-glutamyltransferase [Alteromonas mediterranea]|uniref:Glutathione hydrolase proenzyme n=1 Tax=Alteromonas mediterranea TaxID=314275 RepID=A0AAC8XK91_9ALTE|nr:gamma-glutamyltransferase [Alteromonas mediterranea]AFV85789.1 gamma-glutamyltranspeptidase [Alteromonas mediterranea DE1]AGP97802.1 gamma-glutamyltranspeptidase [Alteromonas mediterranea UM7]AGQ02054.1 gamma-glutamyltranspeptidase [Alteromonas mediterranea UM4b]AMJ78828.1 gamma-glutamyltransferase [Alteromonas mediterranea]AMJ82977.1 gamma-glutamyltransferase [Alteromonas mediterranea]
MRRSALFRASVVTLALSSCFIFGANAKQAREVGEPEAATGYVEKQAFEAKDYMVVAANPYASWAGKNILEKGGSAIDAAVAVQSMLSLVEPQSSGIGGGAFILYWDNKNKVLHTFDGRETAPKAVNSHWFIEGNKPMRWIDAVVGGKSVGVPGAVKALEMAQKEFGKLPWNTLFDDTIKTAEDGFKVSPRLAKLVALDYHPGLKTFPASSTYFFPAGLPLKEGTVKKNKKLAKTLKGIAEKGSDYLLKGEVAEKIVKAVNSAEINPGQMTLKDLASYEPVKREPVCGLYHEKRICGMAPPSSGGVNVYQILKMLEGFDLSQYAPDSVEFANLYTQASALSYADREKFIADSDFTNLPFAAMINTAYLERRAESISVDKEWRRKRAGNPYADANLALGKSMELPNTSHVSIVDKEGNAVSMTTSIEFMFGSGIMVEGFLLNNQLTDFSFSPTKNRFPVPNRVEPGKRPRSAMSPTMVFDKEGNLEVVVGSPGGSRIVSYVAQTLIGVLDFGLDIQQAINLPKITNRNDYTALEKGTPIAELEAPLKALGHNVKVVDLNSGLHGIQFKSGKLIGGADPRREGIAVGR